MPIIRDWKKYFTIDEVDERLKKSIRKNAKAVAREIKSKIISNKDMYV